MIERTVFMGSNYCAGRNAVLFCFKLHSCLRNTHAGYSLKYPLKLRCSCLAHINQSCNTPSTVQYLHEGAQALGEIRDGQLSHRLLTGLSLDETIARIALTSNGQKDSQNSRIYLTDALNSVIAQLTDDNANPGQLQNSYAYSPYGESSTVGPDGTNNPNQYTSRENDGTGVYFYRARYLDPQLKIWISEDQIGLVGSMNVYQFVNGNPVSFVDPTGEVGIVGGLIGAGIEIGIQGYKNYQDGCDIFDMDN